MGANAQIAVPAFVAGEVLTAAEMTQINTGIPVFATTTTRDAAFGDAGEKTLAEGQFAYIEATNATQYYDGAAWVGVGGGVVQVKSATKTDTFTMASSTYADITGVSISITPTSASNKVFVLTTVNASQQVGTNNGFIRLARGGTGIGVGDAAGSRIQAGAPISVVNADFPVNLSISFLDSPATTSATTYSTQIKSNGSGTMYVNRSQNDSDVTSFGRYSSTITVFEVTP